MMIAPNYLAQQKEKGRTNRNSDVHVGNELLMFVFLIFTKNQTILYLIVLT